MELKRKKEKNSKGRKNQRRRKKWFRKRNQMKILTFLKMRMINLKRKLL